MPVIHIVLFEFKSTASSEQIAAACSRMIELKDTCVHPQTQKNYMKSYGGGRDNSPEGKQGGFTHGFICEFENEEDRDYYAFKDPKHLEFIDTIKDLVVDARVLDFEPGVM